MKVIAGAALLLSSVVGQSTPMHRVSPKKEVARAEPAICASLAEDYEGASKGLAMLEAEGIADNSAPRATMRETQSANILEKARITMDLMKNNGCKGPTSAPSAQRYFSAALKCKTASIKQETAMMQAMMNGNSHPDVPPLSECDRKTWTPE